MKHVCLLCATIIAAISLGHAQLPDGKWKTHTETPNGPMEMMFTFKTNGDTLTGRVEGPWGDSPIINGKSSGKKFTFDVSFGEMTINHWCVVMGDSILMKVPGMQGDTMRLVLKRALETK